LIKRLIVVALALAVCIAVGTTALAAKGGGTTNVKTKVALKYQQGGNPPYNEAARFSGKVKAKKGCKKGRKVKIANVGKTKTDQRGKYEIPIKGAGAPGTSKAKVKKKTIRKNGEKIVCKKGKSNTITVS